MFNSCFDLILKQELLLLQFLLQVKDDKRRKKNPKNHRKKILKFRNRVMMQPEDIVFKVVVASYEHMSKIEEWLVWLDFMGRMSNRVLTYEGWLDSWIIDLDLFLQTPALSCGMHHNWRWSIMKECKILRLYLFRYFTPIASGWRMFCLVGFHSHPDNRWYRMYTSYLRIEAVFVAKVKDCMTFKDSKELRF